MKYRISVLSVLLCVLLTACGGKQESVPASGPPEQPTQTAEPVFSMPENAVRYLGEPVETERTHDSGTPASEQTAKPSVRKLAGNAYSADISELVTDCGSYVFSCRTYDFSDGCTVRLLRAEGLAEKLVFCSETLPETGGISYYDASGEWKHIPLTEGSWQTQVLMLRTDGGKNYFIYTPRTYTPLENHVLDHRTAEGGAVTLKKTENGWLLEVTGMIRKNAGLCDCLILSSENALENWDCDNCAMAWQRYLTNHQGQMCYDGFYYTAPDSYIPTGPDCYYRCAASYIVKVSKGRIGHDPCAAALTVAMLDTVVQVQNVYGYWETGPVSQWLSGDYGIGAGFYDTRFNTDLMEIIYLTNEALGGGLFYDAVGTYLNFYLRMAEQCHYEKNGGWLIPDYWWPGTFQKPHTALNHQAAECLQLYHLSDLLGREDTRELADRLLRGMTETADGYIMPDHNLHYCVRPDFTYGLDDYPELTYNDLLALDRYLIEKRGAAEPKLEMLMAEKKIWMDANGVTTYNK